MVSDQLPLRDRMILCRGAVTVELHERERSTTLELDTESLSCRSQYLYEEMESCTHLLQYTSRILLLLDFAYGCRKELQASGQSSKVSHYVIYSLVNENQI